MELFDWPRGIPFSKVIQNANAANFLSSSVYKVRQEIYLYLTPFRPGSLEKDASGPFVTGVVWAVSDGAVRRALLMEIESDDGVDAEPVRDFLPAEKANSYGAILQELKRCKSRTCQETAIYRIASDRKFVNRVIETERFSFYFRDNKHDDMETPYVIIRKLLHQ